MGSSIQSDSLSSVNSFALLTNDSVKSAFSSFNGVKLRDDIKYGKYGIDVSHWNGAINWNALKQDTVPDKIFFVISKATNGTTSVDKAFANNFKNSKSNGFVRGAYHFFMQKQDPVKQADNFIKNVSLEKGDILPIVDVERNCFSDSACKKTPDLLIPKQEFISNLKIFIDKIKMHYQCDVIIYTNEAFYNEILSEDFKENYFWIAQYNINPPKCFQVGMIYSPGNTCFKNSKKGCWQYTQAGKIKSIEHSFDFDFLDNYYLLKWVIK